MSPARRYLFDTGADAERDRLQAHTELWDAATLRRLDGLGVAAGWRCLEVGAGTGSVAAWLVDRVGPTGQVVATDIETRWLEPLASGNLVVRRHDVGADPIEAGDGYDLVHARFVLEHLPQRRVVAAKLVDALRPGGWLLVEDYDVRTLALTHPPVPGWARVNERVVETMAALGSDATFGSAVGPLLRELGLADVTVDGVVHQLPLPELAPVFRPPLERLRDPLVSSGALTGAEVDAALAAYDADPAGAAAYTPLLVAASGRRPG